MQKKYVVVNYLEHPIFVAPIIDGTSEEYLKIKKEAEANLNSIKEIYSKSLAELKVEIKNLKAEIKHLKGED